MPYRDWWLADDRFTIGFPISSKTGSSVSLNLEWGFRTSPNTINREKRRGAGIFGIDNQRLRYDGYPRDGSFASNS